MVLLTDSKRWHPSTPPNRAPKVKVTIINSCLILQVCSTTLYLRPRLKPLSQELGSKFATDEVRSHIASPYPMLTFTEVTPSPYLRKNPGKKRAPLFREIQPDGPPNIVIFGETGTGKSSLVNMLSDEETAAISNLAVGCTFESTPHTVSINEIRYTLWDTAGLNEANSGSVPAEQALYHLRDLIDKLKGGVSLLVYCIRGSRYHDIIKVNYDLFTEIICQGEVPIVIVVTGLEIEERMDDWWDVNEKEFLDRGMRFQGHACVTTSKGKKNVFETEYRESKCAVSTLINNCCPHRAWVVESDKWFDRITDRIQEYWEGYNARTDHSRRSEWEGSGEETPSYFKTAGLFLLSLVPAFCLSCYC
jgi:GTPase SAR1 family protein